MQVSSKFDLAAPTLEGSPPPMPHKCFGNEAPMQSRRCQFRMSPSKSSAVPMQQCSTRAVPMQYQCRSSTTPTQCQGSLKSDLVAPASEGQSPPNFAPFPAGAPIDLPWNSPEITPRRLRFRCGTTEPRGMAVHLRLGRRRILSAREAMHLASRRPRRTALPGALARATRDVGGARRARNVPAPARAGGDAREARRRRRRTSASPWERASNEDGQAALVA